MMIKLTSQLKNAWLPVLAWIQMHPDAFIVLLILVALVAMVVTFSGETDHGNLS